MLNEQELIQTACEAIGKGEAADWKIAPVEHAGMFATVAPSLAVCLGGALTEGWAARYREKDERADSAQALFKKTVNRADGAVFVTACLGALLLIAGGLHEKLGGFGPGLVRITGVMGIIASAFATMYLSRLRGDGLSKSWAENRARAESARLAYFKSVMDGMSTEPLDQLLALEYTRRFLLDSQIKYFGKRGSDHELAARKTLDTSTQAVFLSSILTGVAGMLSFWYPQLALIASLAVVSSAFSAWVLSRSSVNQDRTNAERYIYAKDRLEEIRLNLDKYRQRAASGDSGAVKEFFEPVFVVLEKDHQAFLTDAERREAAIGEMESRLDAASERLKRDAPQGA